ncbi:MAG: cytochrome c [Myxococcales bacterium]|nr:cytochrome c [Myxococcales bacterium]
MLSKSAARAFFLGGTFLCSAVFIGLTVDTFGKIPKQTRSADLTASVVRGKEIWEAENCMGCHTLFGEGGYYAPDLSDVYVRRGEMFIRQMLTDPEAMYPGERKMVKYDFTDEQKDDVIAFLKWSGNVDLNGFPPEPTIGVAGGGAAGSGSSAGQPLVYKQVCAACHAVGGHGGQVGPSLDGVASRYDGEYLKRWLEDPLAVKADSKMPKLPLTSDQVDELVIYLTTLKAGGAQ